MGFDYEQSRKYGVDLEDVGSRMAGVAAQYGLTVKRSGGRLEAYTPQEEQVLCVTPNMLKVDSATLRRIATERGRLIGNVGFSIATALRF